MIIILKNIPAKTTKQDVKTFITPAVNGDWFSKRGQIKNISILAQKIAKLMIFNIIVWLKYFLIQLPKE